MDFRAPPISFIPDFLLYLFQERKLQPSTIGDYRSSIEDKLGNSPINVSKDRNFTGLKDCFHSNRSKCHRGIPSWYFFLVLQQPTKAPCKPLKEASLKHLTFKTVFLLAFHSGNNRRSPDRHQTDWSKVSLYPSPSFLLKNQLAKEGSDSGSNFALLCGPQISE